MWPSARRSPLRATLALLILGAARIITPVYAAAPPTGAALAGPIPTPTAEIDSQVTDAPSQLELAKRFLIQDGDAGFGANGGFVGWIYDGQKCRPIMETLQAVNSAADRQCRQIQSVQ